MSDRRIIVSRHAVRQYRDRLRDTRSVIEIGNEIWIEVRDALAAGRVSNRKIDGFGLFAHRRRPLPTGQRFVWREDQQVAWIVARDEHEDTVVTTLTRTGASRWAA